MARPERTIDWNVVEFKMKAGCTAKEIYGDLYIDPDTFYDRFKKQFGSSFADYSAQLHSVGKGNIRSKQYEKAMKGDTRMLSLLGIEWLEQGKDHNTSQNEQSKQYLEAFMEFMKQNQILSKDLNNEDNINPNE